MKKTIISLLSLFFVIQAHAKIITFDPIASDSAVTYSYFNDTYTTIYNDYNGNIDADNIKSGGISHDELAEPLKFENWYYESLGDWTFSGMLPSTAAGLTSNTSAGVSYVNGNRLVNGATSVTYTDAKDTWVYIDKNGAFKYEEVANGASQPTTPANSLLLAKVVTSGGAITSVTDKRTTSPTGLRIYEDYMQGLAVSRDPNTNTALTIARGEVDFGASVTNGLRRNTSQVTVDTGVSGRGGLDTGAMTANTYYYVYVVSDDANASNYEGIFSTSSTDATGVGGERLIGWFYSASTTVISPDSFGAVKTRGNYNYNIAKARMAEGSGTIAQSTLQKIATLKFYSSGNPIIIQYDVNLRQGADCNNYLCISIDSAAVPGSWRGWRGPTGGGYQSAGSGMYYTQLDKGEHTFELKVWSDAASIVLHSYNFVVEEK